MPDETNNPVPEVVPGADTEAAPDGEPVATSERALLALAEASAAAPEPDPGSFHYLKTTEMEVRTQAGAPGADALEDRRSLVWEYERTQWTAADGSGKELQETTGASFLGGDRAKFEVDGPTDPRQLLPSSLGGSVGPGGYGEFVGLAHANASSDGLRSLLSQPLSDGSPAEPGHVISRVGMMLATGANPALRSGIYEILSEMPSIEVRIDETDRLGRAATRLSGTARSTEPLHDYERLNEETGQRIGIDRSGPLQRYDLYVDPSTGELLGTQIVLLEDAPGVDVELPYEVAHSTVLANGMVDSVEVELPAVQVPQKPVAADPSPGRGR